MKTLQDCKDRVAQRRGTDWAFVEKWAGRLHVVDMLHRAAELYGRYMRFVGRAQVRGESQDSVRAQHVEAFTKRREERRKVVIIDTFEKRGSERL